MSAPSTDTPTIIPTLRYKDAAKAIDWLCNAFGFERQMVVEEDDGRIAHAQLRYGAGMIMLGSASEDAWGRYVKPAHALGGNSQGAYVIVDDCKAHYERARAAGAEVVMELEDKEYGGAGYGCLDLEGNVWSFGSYDPFAEQ